MEEEIRKVIDTLDYSQILYYKNDDNKDILKKLIKNNETYIDYINKLKDYKYVDEIDEIHIGRYIRWINKYNKLTKGAFIADIYYKNDNIYILCKKYKYLFSINFNECYIFQKYNNSEILIFELLNHYNIYE